MKHLRVAQTIAAPAASVWRLLSVFDYWPEWGTSITAVDAAADRVTDGMTGRVRTIAGIWLPFRVTAVDPGRSWDWAVAGFPADERCDLVTARAEVRSERGPDQS